MADLKISALPAATTPLAGTEVLPIVQSGGTDKVSVADLTAGRAVSAASIVITNTDNTNAALHITQLGTGNALLVEDAANPDSTPVVIDSSGNLISGYTTQFPTSLTTVAQVGVGGTASTSGNGVSILKFRNIATVGPDLEFVKSRTSTIGVNSTVGNADLLGTVTWSGADGTGYVQAASISAQVDGTPGTNDMPGRLVFSTTADGASSPTERMRITSAGNVGIGGTPSTGQRFLLAGTQTFGANLSVFLNQQTIQSDATGNSVYFDSFANLQAAAFTSNLIVGYRAQQNSLSGGAAITSQRGFEAASSLTGATNNYGYYSNIAAAANRYNFFANGTAANYFAGVVQTNAATAIPAGGTTGAGVTVSSAANFGVFFGSGAPTLSAAKGSLYLRSDGTTINDRMYVNTNGSTTWTNVVTAA